MSKEINLSEIIIKLEEITNFKCNSINYGYGVLHITLEDPSFRNQAPVESAGLVGRGMPAILGQER